MPHFLASHCSFTKPQCASHFSRPCLSRPQPSSPSMCPTQKRHRSNDSNASGRDRSYSTDSADMLPGRLREEHWLQDISNTFLQQYVQYLQSMGFILVQVRPQSPARSTPLTLLMRVTLPLKHTPNPAPKPHPKPYPKTTPLTLPLKHTPNPADEGNPAPKAHP
ncbi:hypothetical protein JZ751_019037 [Albula glossodonta]|uniref:Uncharacterized protein n=1 Tax=Albula glossodonta TaxID=121402 RepID=A0A8T2NVB4_9TELE|nr:hypothetical protein JZ751_019037 [Albula glossodonta]